MKLFKKIRASGAARIAVASYFSFASLAISTFVSIPLAVHFLDPSEIGLWAVVNQVLGYLVWMDLGVGQATGRKIADAVIKRDAQELNRWWSATRFVLVIQAFLVLLLGIALQSWALSLFKIPLDFRAQASTLITGAIVIAAISLPMKGVPGLMMAENRFHWIPLIQGTAPWISLGIFGLMLSRGHGVTSYLYGMAAAQGLTWLLFLLLVRTSSLPPRWDSKGLTRKRFKSLFSFSLNLGGIALINSIINSIPALVISRVSSAGIALIPTYTFTTRAPVMGSNLIQRTGHSFYPGLQRLFVAGEREAFRRQFVRSAQITLAFGLMAAGGVLMMTRTVVELLAGKQFFGGPGMVAFLAVGMITVPLASLYQTLRQIAGTMGKTLLFSVGKVAVGVSVAFPAFQHFGLTGLCGVFMLIPLIDAAYGHYRGASACGFRTKELTRVSSLTAIAYIFLVMTAALFLLGATDHGIYVVSRQKVIELPKPKEVIAGAAIMLVGGLALANHMKYLLSRDGRIGSLAL